MGGHIFGSVTDGGDTIRERVLGLPGEVLGGSRASPKAAHRGSWGAVGALSRFSGVPGELLGVLEGTLGGHRGASGEFWGLCSIGNRTYLGCPHGSLCPGSILGSIGHRIRIARDNII